MRLVVLAAMRSSTFASGDPIARPHTHHDAKSRVIDVTRLFVVAPNFKRRLSGVTSTIIQLLPLQAKSVSIASLGAGLPEHIPQMRWRQIGGLLRKPVGREARIFHARRNVEMIFGLVLKKLFRAPVKLLFTSAAQRHHKPFTKFLIRQMDGVIATSARSGSFLDVPHRVIMHGVDPEDFHPVADRHKALEEMGFAGQKLIGCFGRVRHQKGTDLFVDAMIALLPQYPGWTAIITGRVTPDHQAFADDLKKRIEQAGLTHRILMLGEVPDIKPYYQLLSLYVAPSRNEGFGLTPLEAMASGAAIVASDAGAYAEMIIENETGAVVPAGDGPALREAIAPYLADPARVEAHARASLAHVRQKFPLAREAASIGEVYDALWANRDVR